MTQREWIQQISGVLEQVRTKKPLVHHITNYVTVNDCANITLAIGASPIMADDLGEAADITAISSALVLNIGTLNERTIESMLAAGKQANKIGIPVVLDPVGAGASELRNRTTKRILEEVKISVLRGNCSEIRFVAGLSAQTKGVDASEEDSKGGPQAGGEIAQAISKRLGCVTAVTGAIDIVTDGTRTLYLKNGVPELSGVTGTGCMCTSLIGSFCGATDDFLSAAAGGILAMSVAGEIAAEKAGNLGSGSFHVAMVDAISRMSTEVLGERAKLDEA
ncbi:hydroxyethylthiazole kinase [Faecalispora anaeroviscerum]|uniref:hydroxyethylthiazole kinase n=1 Tax=Faecalispora anaeroviscerum TaxID=2991836 RepID=UPI0024BA0335|nr:hydroxyethylthiazole kinase [Faecalispora anaeroviscerum]